MRAALIVLALAAAAPARADDPRPSEGDLFGAPAAPTSTDGGTPAPSPETPSGNAPQVPPGDRDAALLGSGPPPVEAPRELTADNPLTIGGQFYLRSVLTGSELTLPSGWDLVRPTPPSGWGLALPTLTDIYGDARPNERVRGYFRGRMAFDPTVDPSMAAGFGPAPTNAPTFALDQLWLRFDIDHKAYVTAGRQQVKWAAARFWTPTDYLHPVKRDPLAVFDERTGTTMLRVDVPTEKGINVSAAALFEGVDYANQLGKVAGAARAEFVLGASEIGVDAIAEKGRSPRLGGDISFGLWLFDFYGELGVRDPGEVTLLRRSAPGSLFPFETFTPSGSFGLPWAVQATGGVSSTFKYGERDNSTLTVGLEYFNNDALGVDDPSVYPFMLAAPTIAAKLPAAFASQPGLAGLGNVSFPFFYVGKQYLGLFVLLPQPGDWLNTSFTFSTLGNLADKSFVSRLDLSQIVLTNLTLEAYGDVHWGEAGGEFRLGFDLPANRLAGTPEIRVNPALFDVGLALRLSI